MLGLGLGLLQGFGFKSVICLLIAPVPVHCFSITFRLGGWVRVRVRVRGMVMVRVRLG